MAKAIAASTSLTPPPVQRQIQAARRSAIASTILDRLSELVPELARVDRPGSSLEINGGYIFAWGKSDIDDARSRLHRRYEIGVHSHRGYHSIDTGKLTMAPLNGSGMVMREEDLGTPVRRWRCGSTGDGTDVKGEFLPGTCRG